MVRKVDEKTRKKARKCDKAFQCIYDETPNICAVDNTTGYDSVYFVESPVDMFCPYCYGFADGYMCTCPVRHDLYQKYKM